MGEGLHRDHGVRPRGGGERAGVCNVEALHLPQLAHAGPVPARRRRPLRPAQLDRPHLVGREQLRAVGLRHGRASGGGCGEGERQGGRVAAAPRPPLGASRVGSPRRQGPRCLATWRRSAGCRTGRWTPRARPRPPGRGPPPPCPAPWPADRARTRCSAPAGGRRRRLPPSRRTGPASARSRTRRGGGAAVAPGEGKNGRGGRCGRVSARCTGSGVPLSLPLSRPLTMSLLNAAAPSHGSTADMTPGCTEGHSSLAP